MSCTCIVCKSGRLRPGAASAVFERDKTTVVIKEAPALVCDTCGEVYFSDEIAERLFVLAETAFADHAEVEVIRYAA